MFRVTQSQIQSQKLSRLLRRLKSDASTQTEETNASEQVVISMAPLKRRRRSRRAVCHAGPGLRSTWH